MKLMKRTVSVFLAILMLLGSFSILGSAAIVDGYGDTMTFDTKFYRNTGTEDAPVWTETTKAAPGESIVARLFIDADFVVGSSKFFYLYNRKAFVLDYEKHTKSGSVYEVVSNSDPESVAGKYGIGGMFNFGEEQKGVGDDLVYYGVLPEGTFDNYGFLFISITDGKAAKWSKDDYMFEFYFKVNGTPEGDGQIYFPIEALVTASDEYNNWDADASVFVRLPDTGAEGSMVGRGYEESYDWDPIALNSDKDEDSTLTTKSKITFNANGGTLKGDATSEGHIKSAATAPEVAAPAGSEFIGWVPSDKELTAENVVTTITYGYEDTSYTALYSEAAATTANYTVNVYEMGIDGKYPAVPTSSDASQSGDIDSEVNYTFTAKEGFYLDTANPNSVLSDTIAADGSTVLNAYIARNALTVKYVDEKGSTIAALPDETYYYGATYNLANAMNKVGYTWDGWEAGKEVEAKPATNGEVVTYQAAYIAGDNKVVINAYYDDAKTGGTVDLTPYTVNTKTGYTVKIVNELPAEQEANVTYVLKSELPAANHYEVDPDAAVEYTVAVKDDGTAYLEIVYVPKMYTVEFLDADGTSLYKNEHEYFDIVDAPGAPDLSAEGKYFEAWVAVEGEGYDIYDEYGSFDVEGSVTYQATYYDEEYYVFYASEEVDGWDAPALDEFGLPEEEIKNFGDTIVLPDLTDKVIGYEFLGYEVEGAEYDEETRTVTIGTDGVDILLVWDRIEYTIDYYLTEDTSGEPYMSVPYYYGDEVEEIIPEQTDILGQKFIGWTYTPALVDGVMPAENVVAIMDAEPYVVSFYNADGTLAGEKSGATITAEDAAALEATATPTNTTFVEWRNADGEKVAFPVSVTSEFAVYAYCTAAVTFQVGKDAEGNVIGDALKDYGTVTVGYGEGVTAPEIAADYIAGYTFTGWSEIPAAITANTTIVGNFAANAYTATFNAVNGELAGAFEGGATTKTVENIAYNSEFTFADVPVLEGYTFAGWSEDGVAKAEKLVMDAEGKTYTALYTKNGDVAYTVNIYLMDENGNYGEPKPVPESAAFGTTVTKAHADYAQEAYFSADESQPNVYTATVEQDGSTTLALYYKRAQYEVTVDGVKAADVYHGAEFTAPSTSTTTKAGYELANWNDGAYTKGQAITVEAPLALVANNVAVDSEYKVEIYLMDETGSYGAPVIKTETAKTDAVVSKTHADYPQEAWFSAAAEGNDATDKTVAADGSTTLKLYYKRAQYEVTVDGVKAADVYHGAEFIAPATSTTTKAGYELANWNDGAYTKGQTIIVEAPLALVANNVAVDSEYKVEIYLMDETGSYGAPVIKTETAKTDAVVSKTHADYPQEAWFSAAAEGNDATDKTVAADGSTTLKLYYERAQYEVTVDGVKATDVYHGAEFTAPSTSTAVPAGYELTGWTDGTNDYAIGDEITVTGSLALAAKYVASANTYKVEIYLMDTEGNYGAAADTKTITAETDAEVTAAHADYAQDAWFSADDTAANITADKVAADGSTTLKLYYKRAQYEVTVDGVKVADAYYEATFTAPSTSTTTAEGYELVSWNGGAYAKGEEITVKGALNLTADNEAIKYDVVFKINDSVYASTPLAFGTPITSVGTPADEYIPEGYSFKGWSTDGKTVITDFGTVAVNGNTFLAVLEINKYELSFIVDDAVVEGYPVEVEYNSAIVAPTAPDKSADGLTFAGWVDVADETKMPAKMPAKDATYVATYVESGAKADYTVEVYHMNFDGEYELSATTTLSAHVGETVEVKKGDVTGFTFSAADSVLSGKVAADGSTTLKVCYARNLYKATFDDVEYEVYFGQALPKVEPAAQDGKTFIGWTPAVPGSMPAEDLTFTSEWEEAKYTVTYYVNGETTEDEYAYGETIEVPDDPSVEGMEFTGWTGIPADGKMPAKDIIVIANFKAAVYNVTFRNADGSVFEKRAVKFGDDILVPATEPVLEYNTFKGWSGIPADGKMPARDVEVTPIFEAIPVMLIPKNDTCTTIIDRNGQTTADYVDGESEWFIYGLREILKDEILLEEYIDVQGDGRIEIVYNELLNGRTQAPWTGTGTVINVYDNNDDSGIPVESFTIVIFGDLNGDSYVTATDWSIAEDEVAYYTEWSDDTSDDYLACRVMAADFDKNGVIMSADAANICNATLGLSYIDQVEGKVIDL